MQIGDATPALWLAVSDLERSVAFYQETLGLCPSGAAGGIAQFMLGGLRLWLCQRPASAPAPLPAWGALLLPIPEGIEQHCGELEARGVVFSAPLAATPLGRMAQFQDPDGHTLCLWEPPAGQPSFPGHFLAAEHSHLGHTPRLAPPGTAALPAARPPVAPASTLAPGGVRSGIGGSAADSQKLPGGETGQPPVAPLPEVTRLLAQAERAKGTGSYTEAAQCYRRVLEAAPDLAVAWGSLGYVLNELGEYQEGLTASERALALNPTLAEAWNNQGSALDALGRHAEALAAYNQALALAPATPAFWVNLGAALTNLHRYDEALAALDRALALDALQAAAWSNRGWALALLGRYAEALASVDRALALGLDVAGALDTKGYALAGLGRYAEALACYQRALAHTPNDPDILAHAVAARQAMGQAE